ncbi:MAG: T9SS type A sorting domain-containing protein, partial [Bacteroidota bacterium]
NIQGGNNPTFDAASDGSTVGGILIENNGALNFENTGFSLGVTGNITNNSGSGFVADGTITFSGSNQSIQGTGATTITNITVINGTTVDIDAPTTVTNNLTLTNGFVSLTDDNLSITSTGQILNTSASNFIITPFENCLIQQDMGNGGIETSVLFPIGTSSLSYTPATITNPSTGTLDDFCVYVCDNIFEEGTCATGTQINAGVVDKTWFIEEGTLGGSDATLTLQWNGVDEATDFDRTSTNLSRHDGTDWFSRALVAAGGADPYTATAAGLSDFSPHSLISDVMVLPVSLTYLRAKPSVNSIDILWETATEINSDKFIVERSRDAINYEKIGEVSAAGSSSNAQNYVHKDSRPLPGISYYRLRQVDFDGAEEIFGPVSAEIDGTHTQTLYPNPAQESVNIKFDDRFIDTNVSIKLYSVAGDLVQTLDTRAGFSEFTFQFDNRLGDGLYFLLVENQNLTIGQKIIINRR